jgi:hypothetical protein
MLKELGFRFCEFVKDIATSWIGAMSGILSVCLWAFGAWIDPETPSLRISFLVLAFVGLLIACFTGWLKRMPRLVGSIDDVVLGRSSSDNTFVTAFIIMNIRNTGHPSIVEGWKIYAVLADGRRVEGTKELIGERKLSDQSGPTTILIPSQPPPPAPTRVITEADALYRKSLVPIPQGGMIRGWLVASFSGVTQADLSASGAKTVVEFADVWNRPYVCDLTCSKTPIPLGQAQHYPTT